MACSRLSIKHWLLALTLALSYILVFSFKFGKAYEYLPPADTVLEDPTQAGGAVEDPSQTGGVVEDPSQIGGAVEDPSQTGGAVEDPTPIVAKALLCFDDKFIYSSCEETHRLSESGNINVPPEYADQFCSGPCLTETYLVLNCIENILKKFEFYNKATIKDVRDTIKAGCSHGSKRGDFNVAEHIQEKHSFAGKTGIPILFALVLMIIGHGLLL